MSLPIPYNDRVREEPVDIIDHQPRPAVRDPEIAPSLRERTASVDLFEQSKFAGANRMFSTEVNSQGQARFVHCRLPLPGARGRGVKNNTKP